LLGRDVDDVDLATPLVPDEGANASPPPALTAVPTGIEHGIVTAVANASRMKSRRCAAMSRPTAAALSSAFTTDWAEDAQRRDFTINALYADLDGNIHDTVPASKI